MKQIYKYILPIIILLGSATSCDDFLDENPDNRALVDTPEKIAKLLTSAYPARCFMHMTEPASDNLDQNSDLKTNDLLTEAYYNWETDYESGNDKPEAMWQFHYRAIANANLALDAVKELGDTPDLRPHKGEAYITRAYSHFLMSMMFCKHYGATSNTDLGLPYMEKSETEVSPKYPRGTVTQLYDKINEDIEAALPLIDDKLYKIPKYHFNKKAAYAFATRFNLYYGKYDKVIEYANQVLTANPSAMLRDWKEIGDLSGSGLIRTDSYVNVGNPATLLIISTSSIWGRRYGGDIRYNHNRYISNTETLHAMGPWGNTYNVLKYKPTTYTGTNVAVKINKIDEYFERTDPVLTTGFTHVVFPAFTTDEILLCRAEAYILKQDYTNALKDLNLFMTNYMSTNALTVNAINNFYNSVEYFEPLVPTVKKRLNPDFTIADNTQENMLHFVLHLRRILTMHEGLRWQDVKRYGIEIHRRQIDEVENVTLKKTLKKEDHRRAFQLPTSVLSAGLEPNPR